MDYTRDSFPPKDALADQRAIVITECVAQAKLRRALLLDQFHQNKIYLDLERLDSAQSSGKQLRSCAGYLRNRGLDVGQQMTIALDGNMY
jgi:hypothetical protein